MSSYIDLMKNVKKKNKFKVTDISPGLIAGKLISQKLKPINGKRTQIKEMLSSPK